MVKPVLFDRLELYLCFIATKGDFYLFYSLCFRYPVSLWIALFPKVKQTDMQARKSLFKTFFTAWFKSLAVFILFFCASKIILSTSMELVNGLFFCIFCLNLKVKTLCIYAMKMRIQNSFDPIKYLLSTCKSRRCGESTECIIK